MIVEKLKSRKLWIAVFTIAILILQKEYNQAVFVALGYLGVQGYIDSVK